MENETMIAGSPVSNETGLYINREEVSASRPNIDVILEKGLESEKMSKEVENSSISIKAKLERLMSDLERLNSDLDLVRKRMKRSNVLFGDEGIWPVVGLVVMVGVCEVCSWLKANKK